MGKIDTAFEIDAAHNEEVLFMEKVIAGDAELLYLDSYLSDLFGLH